MAATVHNKDIHVTQVRPGLRPMQEGGTVRGSEAHGVTLLNSWKHTDVIGCGGGKLAGDAPQGRFQVIDGIQQAAGSSACSRPPLPRFEVVWVKC